MCGWGRKISKDYFLGSRNIICVGGVEQSVSGITERHPEACRVMTNGDREGRIFLSHPHTNNGFFF